MKIIKNEKTVKKLLVLLVITLAISAITGGIFVAQSMYSEAPMLAERVAAGELPTVDERLPAQPFVQGVLNGIGQYGGTIIGIWNDEVACDPETCSILNANVAQFDYDFNIEPDIVESYALSDDALTFSVTLREGHRWSDGEALTTEDVQFWYDAVVKNDNVFLANTDNGILASGQHAELEIIDDYHFAFHYPEPFVRVLDTLTDFRPFLPAHYLSQFHIDYNENADNLAQEAGFDFWHELFESKLLGGTAADPYFSVQDTDLPVLSAWIYESTDSENNYTFARNPYYHVVDPEGNQLPYADYFLRMTAQNTEVMVAKIVSGEITHAGFGRNIAEFPLLAENADANGYIVNLHPDLRASEFGMVFNYTHKDPVLREIFNDIRFRRALSIAINRAEAQELIFLGQGKPRQPIFDPSASFYEEGIDENAIEYDVDGANALLDEMGLERGADGWRIRPDGAPLQIIFSAPFGSGPWRTELVELIKGYWAEVGVDLLLDPIDGTLFRERLQANDIDMGSWAIGGSSEIFSRNNAPIRYRPPFHWPTTPLGGVRWYQWYESGGEQGDEPPAEVQRLYEAVDEWMKVPRGTETYDALGTEIMRLNAENLWVIGTVGLMPRPIVFNQKLRNVPGPDGIVSVEFWVWGPHQPEQWWFEE